MHHPLLGSSSILGGSPRPGRLDRWRALAIHRSGWLVSAGPLPRVPGLTVRGAGWLRYGWFQMITEKCRSQVWVECRGWDAHPSPARIGHDQSALCGGAGVPSLPSGRITISPLGAVLVANIALRGWSGRRGRGPPAKQSETCAGRCGPPLDTGLASCPERPLTTPDLLSINGARRSRVPAAGPAIV